MPTVKSYGDLSVAPRVTPRVTQEVVKIADTSTPIARGLNELGKGLQIRQDHIDDGLNDEAYLSFQKERNSFLNDPETGFYNQLGKNAFNNKDKALESYDKLFSKYTSELRGSNADKYKNRFEIDKLNDFNQIDRHVSKQFEDYKDTTEKNNIQVAVDTASLNYNDLDKSDQSLNTGISYVVTQAKRHGIDPKKAVGDFVDGTVASMADAALTNEDVGAAKQIMTHYGSMLTANKTKITSAIAKTEKMLKDRGKQERISKTALDVYQKHDGDISSSIKEVETSSMASDEKFSAISKMRQLHVIDNEQRSERQDTIMKDVNTALLSGKSPEEWVASHPKDWDQLTYSQQHNVMSMFAKPAKANAKEIPLSKTNPSLSATIDSFINNGDKGGLAYTYKQFKPEIPPTTQKKIETFLNTDKLKSLTKNDILSIPELAVPYNNMNDKDKAQFLVAINASYVEEQKQLQRVPDNNGTIRLGRNALTEAQDTGEPYFRRYNDTGYKSTSIDTKGSVYTSLHEEASVLAKQTFAKVGIELSNEQAGKMVDLFAENNNYRLPNPYELVSMVDQEMKMRRPVTLKLKTGGYVVIDRNQGGEYIQDNATLVDLYKKDPSVGMKMDTMDAVGNYIIQKQKQSISKIPSVKDKPTSNDVAPPPIVSPEPVVVSQKPMEEKALQSAKDRLQNGTFAPVPVGGNNLVNKTVTVISNTGKSLKNSAEWVVNGTEKTVGDVVKSFDKAMKEGHYEGAKNAHNQLIDMMMDNKTASPYIAEMITRDPLSTDEEKQNANDWLTVYKYGR